MHSRGIINRIIHQLVVAILVHAQEASHHATRLRNVIRKRKKEEKKLADNAETEREREREI